MPRRPPADRRPARCPRCGRTCRSSAATSAAGAGCLPAGRWIRSVAWPPCPVGAASAMCRFALLRICTMPRTMVVLPTPGPPVITTTGARSTWRRAWICWGARAKPASCSYRGNRRVHLGARDGQLRRRVCQPKQLRRPPSLRPPQARLVDGRAVLGGHQHQLARRAPAARPPPRPGRRPPPAARRRPRTGGCAGRSNAPRWTPRAGRAARRPPPAPPRPWPSPGAVASRSADRNPMPQIS